MKGLHGRRVWGGRRDSCRVPETNGIEPRRRRRGLEEAGRLFEFRLPRVDRVGAASAAAGSTDVEGAWSSWRGRCPKASRAAAEARPAAGLYITVGAVDGRRRRLERKRESEAAFTRVASTADWSGSLIARLPPIDAFGYGSEARGWSAHKGRRRRAGRRLFRRRSPAPSPRWTRRRAAWRGSSRTASSTNCAAGSGWRTSYPMVKL